MDLVVGQTYRIHMKGSNTGDGTLYLPFLRGVHNRDGVLFDDTMDYDSGHFPLQPGVFQGGRVRHLLCGGPAPIKTFLKAPTRCRWKR